MKSYEALQKAIQGRTVEHARMLGKSTSLIAKWQEPHTDFTDSGAYNPLDRIEAIVEKALALVPREDALAPVYWLNERFNLIAIPITVTASDSEISKGLLKTVKEFGELASEASKALEDGKFTPQEFKRVEKEGWDAIKEIAAFLNKAKDSLK